MHLGEPAGRSGRLLTYRGAIVRARRRKRPDRPGRPLIGWLQADRRAGFGQRLIEAEAGRHCGLRAEVRRAPGATRRERPWALRAALRAPAAPTGAACRARAQPALDWSKPLICPEHATAR